jgi:DNA polymerase-1
MPPILYLIDGHALAYRTYFALTAAGGARWQTRSGEPTAGVYGFASVILRLLDQEKPEFLAVAFDTGKTFRDDLYPAYKATRAKMPEDLRPQMDRIRQMVDAFHFPRLEMEGFEADDVLGSIAFQAVSLGLGVKIITGDRDLLQLVNDRISVNLASSKLAEAKDYTPPDVFAFLGVRPDQVVDYKALVGDTSDNIPGVPGVGEKTAVSLLLTYSTLDEIYAHLSDITPRVAAKLTAGRESAYLSRQLAEIRTDLHLTLNIEEARTDHINVSAVEELFHQMEFRTLVDRLHNIVKQASARSGEQTSPTQQLALFGEEIKRIGVPQDHKPELHIINTPEQLQKLQGELAQAGEIALDTETTSTDPMRARLVGISLSVKPGEGYYIPVGHLTGETQLPLQIVLDALRPFLTDQHKEVFGHNLKYDCLVLAQHGLNSVHMTFDTMIAEWLTDPGSRRLGLKDMAAGYLDIGMTHIEELIGKGKNQITMAEVPVETAAPYAAADAEVTFQLVTLLRKRMAELNADRIFHDIEMPLIPVLLRMEQAGIALDKVFFQQMAGELSQRLNEIEIQIFAKVGYSFNLNSTQQLSKVLFETLKLDPPDRRKKTSSGHYSTSADVLEELSGLDPVVDWMLEYRELSKLKSTYVDALPIEINPQTGRVHTSFNQTGSVTGRLASSDPNLQNIPTRTEIGRRVRQGFIASEGLLLLSVDYSQIELRIVAHMSGDEAMLNAFHAGQDIHAATASAILNIDLEKVTKEQRRHAKTINFGLIYGMSAFGLSRSTDLTLAEAENFVKAYFQQFPGVKQYLDQIRRLATSTGYVETLLGRRRYFPNLRNQSNQNLRAREEREAINAPIQGTAADIMKIAMIRLPAALEFENLSARLLLQVHDELVLECKPDELAMTAKVVQKTMENAYTLSIPLLTEARYGKNWGNLKPLTEAVRV